MKIDVNVLSEKSIKNAIAELTAYKTRVQELPKKIMEAAAIRLEEILTEQAPPEIRGRWSAPIYDEENQGWVISIDGVAEFVEFGTGIKGRTQHSGINPDWLDKLPPYEGNRDWNAGPKIKRKPEGNRDDPHSGWWYTDGAQFHWTQGNEANPFIYRSVTILQEEFEQIALRVAKENGF